MPCEGLVTPRRRNPRTTRAKPTARSIAYCSSSTATFTSRAATGTARRQTASNATADWKGRTMHRISKQFSFEAAHFLGGLPDGHPCSRVHGHSYTVEVFLAAEEMTGPGFVVDFRELAPLKKHLDDNFDHQTLNDVLAVEPTSENLAKALFDWCMTNLPLPETAGVEAVRVSETAKTWAEYRPTNTS